MARAHSSRNMQAAANIMRKRRHMLRFPNIFISVSIFTLFSIPSLAQQSSPAAAKPEKPVETVLRIVYYPLANYVGETFALVILIFAVGFFGYLTKDAIPKAMKAIVSLIAGFSERLFRHTIRYRACVIDQCRKVRVGYKDTDIDVERDYVSLRIRTGKTMEVDDALRRFECIEVRGDPGAGKTTLLKYLAIKYAMKKMKHLHGRHLVPVFIALKDAVDSAGLFEYAAETFEAHCKDGKSYLESLLKKGGCIVLLDGVDEVDWSREKILKNIEAFRRKFHRNRFVVTLRKEGYEHIRFHANFRETSVAPLTENRMKDVAFNVLKANLTDREKYPPAEIGRIVGDLMNVVRKNERLKMLGENPMLMSIIALVYAEHRDLPSKRAELYELCVKLILGVRELRYKNELRRFVYTPEQKYHALRKIAFALLTEKSAVISGVDLKNKIVAIAPDLGIGNENAGSEADAFIDELLRVGVLRHISTIHDTYDFVHKTFREYFAAREIYANRIELEPSILENAENSNWREVVLLYIGVMDEPADMIARLIRKGHVALAAEGFVNAGVPSERIRRDLMDGLFNMVSGESAGRDGAMRSFSDMALLAPDAFVSFFNQIAGNERFLSFFKEMLNAPGQRPSVKKAVFRAALKLEPEQAERFGEYMDMVYIPAGKSVVGMPDPIIDGDPLKFWDRIRGKKARLIQRELPRQEVDLPAYFMDKFPVTNAQYKLFMEAGGYEDRKYWSGEGWNYIRKENRKTPYYWDDEKWNRPDQPVVGVTWYEADAFARWAGKELPTEIMWEKAARGTDERPYPWGNEEPGDTRCNFGKKIGKTTNVGKYEAGKSPYGAYDMAGNVWEWCADWFDEDEDVKVLRGGSWYSTDFKHLRWSFRGGSFPLNWSSFGGFRCTRT